MTALSPSLIDHFARRLGIVSSSTLDTLGVSSDERRHLVGTRIIERVHDTVYRLTAVPATFESNCLAACEASRDLVIAGESAARLWGFRHTARRDLVVASVAHDRSPVRRGVILRRTNVLDAVDIVERDDGIRLTAPSRTWFDRANDLTDLHFESLTEQVLDKHCAIPTLWATARRLARRGRPGSARVRRVLSQRAAWQKPADSGLELRVLKALEGAGVTLVRQFPLQLRNGIVIHLDGADPDLKWGVEVDHVTWHGGRLDAQADKRRDRQARRIGWEVERVTDQELDESFDAVIADLLELRALRAESTHESKSTREQCAPHDRTEFTRTKMG